MPKTETTILSEKRNFGTKAAIEANISQMEDGEMVYITDDGITPPIPTSADNNKILAVVDGKYTLISLGTGLSIVNGVLTIS